MAGVCQNRKSQRCNRKDDPVEKMSEDFPKIESPEVLQGKPVNFFEMDEKDKVDLKERISAANGTVRIFVHPYWAEYRRLFPSPEKEREPIFQKGVDLKEAEKAFGRILSNKSAGSPPVILFLEAPDIKGFQEQWGSLNNRDFYAVPTLESNPDPITPEFMPEDISERSFSYWNMVLKLEWSPDPAKKHKKIRELAKAGWERLISQMKELGVRKVLIGGMEFYASSEVENPHGGCAGETFEKLKEAGFQVELSALSWPQGRKEVKQAVAEPER